MLLSAGGLLQSELDPHFANYMLKSRAVSYSRQLLLKLLVTGKYYIFELPLLFCPQCYLDVFSPFQSFEFSH